MKAVRTSIKFTFGKWVLIALTGASVLYVILTLDHGKFDVKYTSQIDKFEKAYSKLKTIDLADLRNKYDDVYGIFPHAGVVHDFSVSKKFPDYLKSNIPELQRLFDSNLIEDVHILSNGEILFQLKHCDRPDCENRKSGGFHGFYTHYLSKDNVRFKQLSYTRLTDAKSFGNWNYYIVWSAKG